MLFPRIKNKTFYHANNRILVSNICEGTTDEITVKSKKKFLEVTETVKRKAQERINPSYSWPDVLSTACHTLRAS